MAIDIKRISPTLWEISDGKQVFNINRTPETYVIDGHYFVSPEELLNILTEIRLADELNDNQRSA